MELPKTIRIEKLRGGAIIVQPGEGEPELPIKYYDPFTRLPDYVIISEPDEVTPCAIYDKEPGSHRILCLGDSSTEYLADYKLRKANVAEQAEAMSPLNEIKTTGDSKQQMSPDII